MNVLLTSVGRRNYLAEYFKSALKGRGKVFVVDASPFAPANTVADEAFFVPKVKDPKYFDELITLVKRHEIKLVIPLNDLELPLIARQKSRFLDAGAQVVVADPDIVDMCIDKLEMRSFLDKIGIATPPTAASYEEAIEGIRNQSFSFPLVIKARYGSASIGMQFVDKEEYFTYAYKMADEVVKETFLVDLEKDPMKPRLIVQELIKGKEYNLDIVNDLRGQYRATMVKEKIAMRSGETDQAVTRAYPVLASLGESLGRATKHLGNLDCDVMVRGEEVFVLDLNPRFGGGYPFSHCAGADLPSALIAWAEGHEPERECLDVQPDVRSAKAIQVVRFQ